MPNRYSGDGIPLPAVLFTYIVIGPVTGFLYGLLFPFLRVPLLAYLAGVLASVPFSLSVAVTVSGEPWSSGMVLFVGGCIAVTLGGFGGLIVRDVFLE